MSFPRLGAVLLLLGGGSAQSIKRLNNSEPVEYEQLQADGWRWFVLTTHDVAAVTAGLVVQRGYGNLFPKMGFVMMASPSGIPPGFLSQAEYDPMTYAHDYLVGPYRRFIWDTTPSVTDWRVLTIGYDDNRTDDEASDVQVLDLNEVLIGVRCNEFAWSGPIPGCRYSLTATLLPFEMTHNMIVAAPMGRQGQHVYKLTVGEYDSLNVSLERQVRNASDFGRRPRGLVGAAMLGKGRWSRPSPLAFPYNLTQRPGNLFISPAETQAMLDWQYAQLRADKGLLNLAGCADGDGGCRRLYLPVATENAGLGVQQEEREKQEKLRARLFARSLATGRSYAALHVGSTSTYVERLCLGPGDNGTYYLTLSADAELSGDGRLSASVSGYHATIATDGLGPAVPGVDTTGWRFGFEPGCWCCEGGVCGECGDGFPGQCYGTSMPPATTRMVLGYVMRVTSLKFSDGLVAGNSEHRGCVSYGQWRYYSIVTTGAADAQLFAHISAPVGGVYAALGRRPTTTDYDRRLQPPLEELSLSPCDVTEAATWYLGVHLEPQSVATVPETLFTLRLRTADATVLYEGGRDRNPAIAYEGGTCCGGMMHWRVPDVPSSHGLSVNLSVLSGAVHAVFINYDSCASYSTAGGGARGTCPGLCDIGWTTLWDPITGVRSSLSALVTKVSMGETLSQTDKRRAGTWYVGVKALHGEAARYQMRVALAAPARRPPTTYCSGHERFCASATQRGHSHPLTTAAEMRTPVIDGFASAAAPSAARASASTLALALVVCVVASSASEIYTRRRVRTFM